MGVTSTAHQKIVTLLQAYAPSPTFTAVYTTHETANLAVPSLSIEPEATTPIINDGAIVSQELIDNWSVQLSIRIHVVYRLGPIDTESATDLADEVIRWLREHINLADGYRIFDIVGAVYNVEHTSSGTAGSELIVNIHKVESYEQI